MSWAGPWGGFEQLSLSRPAPPHPAPPSPFAEPQQVLPLFCFDSRFLGPSAWGTPKTGPYRAQFLLEAVLDLKDRLRGVGSDLLVHLGRPEDVIPGEPVLCMRSLGMLFLVFGFMVGNRRGRVRLVSHARGVRPHVGWSALPTRRERGVTLLPLTPCSAELAAGAAARKTLVLAQSEVTSEELAVERRVKSVVSGQHCSFGGFGSV